MALLCRFVEDEGGRNRDVERFNRLPHGNRETLVGLRNSVGRKSCDPSPPSTMATGPVNEKSGSGVPSRGTVATIETPCSRSRASVAPVGCLVAIGTRNVLPMAPRSAFQPNGSAVPSAATRPVAPQPSAARTMAPTFPASWTPCRITMSCGAKAITSSREAAVARASATKPVGCLTGLMAAITCDGTPTTSAPARSRRSTSRGFESTMPSARATTSRVTLLDERFFDRGARRRGATCRSHRGRARRRGSVRRGDCCGWRCGARRPIIGFAAT